MSSEPKTKGSLALTSAGYQVRNSLISVPGPGSTLLLRADPRRWYLYVIQYDALAGPILVYPGPYIASAAIPGVNNLPFERAYRDDPAGVPGEWWVEAQIAVTLLVQETLFIG